MAVSRIAEEVNEDDDEDDVIALKIIHSESIILLFQIRNFNEIILHYILQKKKNPYERHEGHTCSEKQLKENLQNTISQSKQEMSAAGCVRTFLEPHKIRMFRVYLPSPNDISKVRNSPNIVSLY